MEAQEIRLDGLEEKIEGLIPPSVNDTTPGLVIGIMHKGELIFGKGYGLANLSYGLPNDTKKVYNLGSVSKQFLGFAFAMLHAQGQLNVDEPVSKFLDDWPTFKQEVTVRHLLSHSSGYREAYTMSSLAGRSVGIDRLSREECLNVVRKQPALEFIPGSRFTYNSTAWVILAEILKSVTGQEADIWVEENILRPLAMKQTEIESYVGEVIPNAAESYYFDQGRGYGNPKSNRAIFGAAEVYSSIEDLTYWIRNFKNPKVGGQGALDVFSSPFKFNNGEDSEYGFGINIGRHKGIPCWKHTGAHESFLTQLRYYPDQDLGIVTISNYEGNGWIRSNELAEFILGDLMTFPEKKEYEPILLTSSQLQNLAGTYISESENQMNTVEVKNDTLSIWGNVKMIPISVNRFYSNSWGGEFEFMTEGMETSQLVVHADSKSVFNKVEDWDPSRSDLKIYAADYHSKELETIYHLKMKNDQLFIKHRWLGEIELTAISKDLFQSDWGWFLAFDRDENDLITGLHINSGRTLNVTFDRLD